MGLHIKLAGLKSYAIPSAGYNHEWSSSIRTLKSIKYMDKEETSYEIFNRNMNLFLNKWKEIIEKNTASKNVLRSDWVDVILNNADLCIKNNQKDKALEIYYKIVEQYSDDVKV
jgi:hypothetical protein